MHPMYMRTRWRWLLSPIHSNILQCHASAVLRTWQHLLSFRRLMRFIFTNIVDAARATRYEYPLTSIISSPSLEIIEQFQCLLLLLTWSSVIFFIHIMYLFCPRSRVYKYMRHCEWNHSCIRQGMNQKVAHKTLSMIKLTTSTPSIFSLCTQIVAILILWYFIVSNVFEFHCCASSELFLGALFLFTQ